MSAIVPKRITEKTRKFNEKHLEIMMDSITIITKDDPRFAKIAAQCTPPSEIRTHHGMNKQFYQAKMDSTYRYNKQSTRTLLV